MPFLFYTHRLVGTIVKVFKHHYLMKPPILLLPALYTHEDYFLVAHYHQTSTIHLQHQTIQYRSTIISNQHLNTSSHQSADIKFNVSFFFVY